MLAPAVRTVYFFWVWYLAVDTQLYLFSPLLLIPTWKWGPKFLLPTSAVLALLSMGCVFANFMIYDLSPSMTAENTLFRMEKTYYPTHSRYAPWLVGFILSYYMLKNRFNKAKLSRGIVFSCWLGAFAVMMAIIFGLYPKHQIGATPMTRIESAFFESCSRVSWSIAIAWIVFACHNGYGGFINSFLSYPIFQMLGRLTYSIYIVHMVLEICRVGITRVPQHFSNYEVMNTLWGDFGLTLLISVVVVLAFESPIIGIEKAIFGGKAKPKMVQTQLSNNNERNGNGNHNNDEHFNNLGQAKQSIQVY